MIFFLRGMLHLWTLILVNDLCFFMFLLSILSCDFDLYIITPCLGWTLYCILPCVDSCTTAGWYVLILSNHIKVLFCATFHGCCAQHSNPDTFPQTLCLVVFILAKKLPNV